MATAQLEKVDHAAIKTSQITIVVLNILAFILNLPIVAAIVAAAMGIGTLLKTPGFGFLYKYGLKSLGWVGPDVLDDNPEPHRFAQFLGFLFMAAGSLALYLNASILGWTLVGIVAALAALNAFGGFCVGCAIYYWLGRLKVPGFTKQPPAGTFPGTRPKTIGE